MTKKHLLAGGLAGLGLCALAAAQSAGDPRLRLQRGALRGELVYPGRVGPEKAVVVALGRFTQGAVRADGKLFYFPELGAGPYEIFVFDPSWCQTTPMRVNVGGTSTADIIVGLAPRGVSRCIETARVRDLPGASVKFPRIPPGPGRMRLAVYRAGYFEVPPVDIRLELKMPGQPRAEIKNVDVSRVFDLSGLPAPGICRLEVALAGKKGWIKEVALTPDVVQELQVDLKWIMR